MIERLIDYFTIAGILSVLCWGGTLFLLLAFFRHRQRTLVYWVALGLILLGWSLGELNSRSIASIRVDRSAEEEAMRERQRAVRQAEYQRMLNQASGIRFAEDAPGDELDPAGMESERQMSVYERAAEGQESEPAYRQEGPRKRMIDGEAHGRVGESGEDFPSGSFTVEEGRSLEEHALLEARRWDSANRFALNCLFLLTLGAVVGDYLYRFNRTSRPYAPIPLSGPWLDRLVPTRSASQAEAMLLQNGLRNYAETILRKGETFCLFHPEDPWPGQSSLPRWPRWIEKNGLWNTRLPKQTFPRFSNDESEYIWESLWFNRACFCILGSGELDDWAPSLEVFLRTRFKTHARARQTVHLVFSGVQPPDPTTLERWRRLGGEVNFCLLFTSRGTSGFSE